MKQFQIRVGMSNEDPMMNNSQNELCYEQEEAIGSGETAAFPCAEVTAGRYVTVQLGYQGHLNLCEVEVYPVGTNSQIGDFHLCECHG